MHTQTWMFVRRHQTKMTRHHLQVNVHLYLLNTSYITVNLLNILMTLHTFSVAIPSKVSISGECWPFIFTLLLCDLQHHILFYLCLPGGINAPTINFHLTFCWRAGREIHHNITHTFNLLTAVLSLVPLSLYLYRVCVHIFKNAWRLRLYFYIYIRFKRCLFWTDTWRMLGFSKEFWSKL